MTVSNGASLQRNVFEVLDRAGESHYRDRPGFGFDGETLTFRQMRDRALSIAGGLAAHGVQSGDKVAVMLTNRWEWFETFFGLAALGAVCVPVNVLLTGSEITHVCEDSGARFLILDEAGSASASKISTEFTRIFTVGDVDVPSGTAVTPYADLTSGHNLPDDHIGPDLNDVFILYYSSGTTGLPKAAVHTHNGVLWNSYGQVAGLALTPNVRYAVIPSLSWAAGFHNLVLALIWIGGYSELRRIGGTTMDGIVAGIEEDRITHIMMVPSLLRDLVQRPDLMARLSASTLEWIITGSEPVPYNVISAVCRGVEGVDICQGYGLSEFPSIATVLLSDEVLEHEGSAGRPLPHTEVALRSEEDGLIKRSGRGELLIRSLSSMVGYHNRPEATSDVMRDGWLHTGDLVEIDQEGFVSIVGRTKDLIISGGLNVYPKEVEDVISRIPGVREVAVVGIAHERFGETPVAIIVAASDFDKSLVDEACSEVLASYKRPKKIIIRAEPLPRNANAKLLKRELRPWAADQIASASSVGEEQ